jgi:hypothetical protein
MPGIPLSVFSHVEQCGAGREEFLSLRKVDAARALVASLEDTQHTHAHRI